MPQAKKPARQSKPKKPDPTTELVTTTYFAKMFGVTVQWINRLKADGIIPSEGRGRLNKAEACQAYAAYLKDGAEKKTGTASLDRLREEKALDIQLTRQRKDRQLIATDEAIGTVDEIVGIFVSSLQGLPAQITGVPRERQRLNDIFDTERQRLADRFAEKRAALLSGDSAADPAAEDDAA